MSFSLCAVIAEAFKRERQQLKPAAGASECTGQFTGQPGARVALLQSPILLAGITNMQQEHPAVSFRIPILGHSKSTKSVTHVVRSFCYLCP